VTRTVASIAAALALALAFVLASDAAAPLLSAPAKYAATDEPGDIVVRDFNRDGIPDAAIVGYDPGTLAILLGQGGGRFGAPTTYPAQPRAVGLAAGDVNGDGNVDLLVGTQSTNSVQVFLGDGSGHFTAGLPVVTGQAPNAPVLADLNGDGKLDLVTGNADVQYVTVMMGNGDGTFTLKHTFTGDRASSVAVADFNGDGKLDLAVAEYSLDTPSVVSVMLGQGGGDFGPAREFATGGDPVSVVAADVDGDGKLDLVTSDFDSLDVAVLRGRGDGSFQAPRFFRVGGESGDVAVADVDGDGHLDLLATDSVGVTVLPGLGGGRFGPRAKYRTGFLADSVAVAPSGGSHPDVLVTNFGDDELAVLTNQTTRTPACVVPDVYRLRLATAKRVIRSRGCRVGSVRKVRSRKVPRGRVAVQAPDAEVVVRAGTRVRLGVSRGRH
jgi:hypothetical protein